MEKSVDKCQCMRQQGKGGGVAKKHAPGVPTLDRVSGSTSHIALDVIVPGYNK